jgi:superfamily II DNA/RNA helicase
MAEPTREDLAEEYLSALPYPPYALQEEAILAWFTSNQGVLVSAPTGTGKTLIAEGALFEALRTGTTAYYTTPLIALTEQKFAEMQNAARRWGYDPSEVGLVTGNRRINPKARILVVVAEILLNRLLNPEVFDFSGVTAVVMDEFHSINDPERGIVWELSLGLLPKHVRLLLLSATVGNSAEFLAWLDRSHGRKLDRVEGKERKVPLTYVWVPDQLLTEQVTRMAQGDAASRQTPALVFCFNRDECWSVAETLKGCSLIADPERSRLLAEVNALPWSQGVGPKLKQILMRGVGVHHAGVLPKYRRVVEDLFQRKLLAVAVCTETLAAGINLPARSVLLSSLVKGPHGNQKLLDPSTAHQIFGRAGRPQFDTQGFVFALAHEDDVRILRWKEKYDQIPEDTRDPLLIRAKKALKKKKPTRRENETYWNEAQFEKLKAAPPVRLSSKGPFPWRLLAYMLKLSPEVARIQSAVKKRLMDEPRLEQARRTLVDMLLTLEAAGYVTLEPKREPTPESSPQSDAPAEGRLLFDFTAVPAAPLPAEKPYEPVLAHPTPRLDRLLMFRTVSPLYGDFLLSQLGIADAAERMQALESVLEMPRTVARLVRVPRDMPPGPLAVTRLDPELVARGLIAAPRLPGDDSDDDDDGFEEERPPVFAEKLRLLFDALNPGVADVRTQAVWAAGELLEYAGDFNQFVKSRDLVKQEGILFRHLLRLILLCEEMAMLAPPDIPGDEWKAVLGGLSERLTASCRQVDPASTDEIIQQAHAADVVEGEHA